MSTVNVTLRIDEQLKKQAENLFSDLGLSFNSAMNIFLKQSVREQQIPFLIKRDVPNADTLAALREVKDMKQHPSQYPSYSDVDSMMEDLLK